MVPRQVDFSIEGTCQLLVLFYLSKKGSKMSTNDIMFQYTTMWNDGIKCWRSKHFKNAGKYDRFAGCCYTTGWAADRRVNHAWFLFYLHAHLYKLDMHPLAAASRSRLLCSKRPIMRSAFNVSLHKT